MTLAAPLPLPVTGTLSATQNGRGTSESLGHLPLPVANTPNVTIGNTSSSPVLTRDVDQIPHPFQAHGEFSIAQNLTDGSVAVYSVPPGRELVIEYLSAACGGLPPLPAGQAISANVTTTGGGIFARTLRVNFGAPAPIPRFAIAAGPI